MDWYLSHSVQSKFHLCGAVAKIPTTPRLNAFRNLLFHFHELVTLAIMVLFSLDEIQRFGEDSIYHYIYSVQKKDASFHIWNKLSLILWLPPGKIFLIFGREHIFAVYSGRSYGLNPASNVVFWGNIFESWFLSCAATSKWGTVKDGESQKYFATKK